MRIIDALGKHKNFKKYSGLIGLEIETETDAPYDAPKFSFWHTKPDGSLRDFGIEYVLKQPVKYNVELDAALGEFKSKTEHLKFKQNSITTSVHVHLNMLNETFTSLGNFMTAYTLVENLLIRFSGDDRRSNLFCLPICDAEETYKNIVRMMSSVEQKNYGSLVLNSDQTKYAALNLSALGQYGSLEFRSFRGITDINAIKTWINLLYAILEYSKQPGLIPTQIVEGWRDKQAELLGEIFGEYRKIVRVENEEALVEKNFWYACSIAYSVKDWATIDQEPKEKKLNPKDLDDVSMKLYGFPFDNLSNAKKEYVMGMLRNGGFVLPKKKKSFLEDIANVGIEPAWDRPVENRMVQLVVDEAPVEVEAEFLDEEFVDEEDL